MGARASDSSGTLFEGNEALFEGLAVHEGWDWSLRHPVVRISFGSGHYLAICGYTDADLDAVFAPELPGFDRETVRDWYNGYGWRGEEKVYNPYDILLLFDTREFAAHWFETGTPTFLVDTLFRRRVSSLALDGMVGSAELLSTFDVDDMPTEALLFQTGHLTIERPEPRGGEMFYRLGYPNREVRQSLNRSLLNRTTGDASRLAAHSARLYDLLLANDFTGLAALFESSSRASRTSGTRTTTSRTTRASTPACSTRTSRRQLADRALIDDSHSRLLAWLPRER